MRRWNRKSDEKKLRETRLIRACQRGATTEVRSLLAEETNVLCCGEHGTPLHYACRNGFYVVATLLLEAGSPTNLFGDTDYIPLHIAARGGYANIAELLLKHATSPDVPSRFERRTPLHLAAEAGHEDVVRVLVAHKAHIDARDLYGTSPLHACSRAGHSEAVKVLLEAGASINGNDNEGWTPLHAASQAGQNEVVILLLASGAFVDAQNRYGRSPLHWACLAGHYATVDLLLAKGADAGLCDTSGRRASQVSRHVQISKLLRIYEDIHRSKVDPTSDTGQSVGQLMLLRSQLSEEQTDGVSESDRPPSPDCHQAQSTSGPNLEDIELCYDSGIDDHFGQVCADEFGAARSRYKGLLNTVSALLGVMESKTEVMSSTIVQTIEGTPSVSYVDVFKQLYGYVQTIESSLSQFRFELTAEGMAVERSISDLVKKCAQAVEDRVDSTKIVSNLNFLHYLGCYLEENVDNPDFWQELYRHLLPPTENSVSSDHETEAFLLATQNLYPNTSDRILSVLLRWLVRREDNTPKACEQDLYRAIEQCTLSQESRKKLTTLRNLSTTINNICSEAVLPIETSTVTRLRISGQFLHNEGSETASTESSTSIISDDKRVELRRTRTNKIGPPTDDARLVFDRRTTHGSLSSQPTDEHCDEAGLCGIDHSDTQC